MSISDWQDSVACLNLTGKQRQLTYLSQTTHKNLPGQPLYSRPLCLTCIPWLVGISSHVRTMWSVILSLPGVMRNWQASWNKQQNIQILCMESIGSENESLPTWKWSYDPLSSIILIWMNGTTTQARNWGVTLHHPFYCHPYIDCDNKCHWPYLPNIS